MKKYILLILCMGGSFLMAQDITGAWNGVLDVMGTELRLVFNVEKTADGFTTKLDSPDQGAMGLPTSETSFSDGTLTIKADALNIHFEGNLDEEAAKFTGTFKQNGMSLPLELSREKIEKSEKKPRPQDPEDFPYEQEEVKIHVKKGGHNLAATLTMPSDAAFKQVAILITGSGPQDRNEELMNHRPFLVLSDYLTRQGIAVLRYDDRGVGESTGEYSSATSVELADDAAAAVDYLAAREDMKGKKIGLIGHSEGGMIAPIAFGKNDKIDFIVSLAGPGVPCSELLLNQIEDIARADGEPEADIRISIKTMEKVLNKIAESPDLSQEELKPLIIDAFMEGWDSLTEEQKKKDPNPEATMKTQAKTLSGDWFRYFLGYNPDEFFSKVTVPVLAINGELDLQVSPKDNLAGIEKSLKKAGNKNYKIVELKQLNHLFQKAETGSPSEYASIDETFNEKALKLIADWVLEL